MTTIEPNIHAIDPFTFLCEMIPYMAFEEDKMTRLNVAKEMINALQELKDIENLK